MRADTVESGRIGYKRKNRYCFVTLAESKLRLYLAKQLQDIILEKRNNRNNGVIICFFKGSKT